MHGIRLSNTPPPGPSRTEWRVAVVVGLLGGVSAIAAGIVTGVLAAGMFVLGLGVYAVGIVLRDWKHAGKLLGSGVALAAGSILVYEIMARIAGR